jgi:HSP20 family protein
MAHDWDAFMRQVDHWTQEIERFMAHVNKARAVPSPFMALTPMASVLWRPAVNVYETTDAVVVQAELAGVDPKEVTIQYESGRLLGWGQRREAITAEAQAIHRLEIESGPFAFQTPLPAAVDAEAAKATLHAGILEVHLPKRPTHHSGVIRLYPAEGERRST